jgi:hypothetical protein
MAVLFTQPYQQFFDANGDPLAGGKVYTYEAGTTTPKAAYTDHSEVTALPNPIVLDSAGRATIWISGNYRYEVRDSADVLIREVDAVTSFNTTASSLTVVTTTGNQTIAGVKTFTDINNSYGFPIAQCRLVRDGSNLRLNPYNGNKIIINGVWYSIPDAGVSLAPSGTTNDTTYYIYAYMNSGTMTLEYSTTGHVAQAGTGVRVKSGDATRTLVGMARTGTSAWQTSPLLIRSYFNRPQSMAAASFTADRTTTSTSFVELNSEIRVPFLIWADEVARASTRGAGRNSIANAASTTGIAFDGTTPEAGVVSSAPSVNSGTIPFSLTATKSGLAEGGGYYATLVGNVTAGTGTWFGAGAFLSTLEVQIG